MAYWKVYVHLSAYALHLFYALALTSLTQELPKHWKSQLWKDNVLIQGLSFGYRCFEHILRIHDAK